MFRGMSVAKFESNGQEAMFIIDGGMSVANMQSILNELMYFCVQRTKENQAIEDQRLKDEEANKKIELEQVESPEEVDELHEEEPENIKE